MASGLPVGNGMANDRQSWRSYTRTLLVEVALKCRCPQLKHPPVSFISFYSLFSPFHHLHHLILSLAKICYVFISKSF
ncbi:hypothetical protein SLEP1_g32192 [Rubroshorea leprosula]|uniref:Uncharacterized protein n=1 Tax=Rubroshorea leprosula TaxID=152421 RepID=A0AAV5KCL6_9ROSI|nr:hypothetical protein SLEP1_g32192 [Rubroshorea leprosula]